MLQSAGLKAGTPGRSAGLGGKFLGGAGLKNGGFGGILEDLEQFIRESPYEGGAGLGGKPFATLALSTLAGGTATGTSWYVRDPDGNLLEFIVYPTGEAQ